MIHEALLCTPFKFSLFQTTQAANAMFQPLDSCSTQEPFRPDASFSGVISRKQSSNGSLRSNEHSSALMEFNGRRTTPDVMMLESQDNRKEPPSPRQISPRLEVPPPAHIISQQSPRKISHQNLEGSKPNLTLETSTVKQHDWSKVKTPSLSNLNVTGLSESHHHSSPAHYGHENLDCENGKLTIPEHNILVPNEICSIYPTWPSKIPRWDDTSTFVDPKTIQYDIKAGRKDYSRPGTVGGSDWEWLIHPDGLPYFYHREKHVITEAYIPQDDMRIHVEKIVNDMEKYINNAPNIDPTVYGDHQRVLVFQNDGEGKLHPYYYFVDHEHQSIFWFEDLAGDELVMDLQVDDQLSEVQFGLRINSEYWMHRSLYPGLQPVTAHDVAQMRNAVHSAMSDTIFSAVSTSPFPSGTLKEIEELMEKRVKIHSSLLSSQSEHCLDPVLERLLAQTLHSFSNKRFLDFYGEKLSRLSSDQHLHPGSHAHRTSSISMFALTCLLFFSPRPHLKKLREVYVDFIVVQHSWKEYLERLNQEWEAILILAGIVLAVVVSFLTIPSVDTSNGPPVDPERSPIQLLGYASVILNVGSIFIILILKSLFYKSKSHGQATTLKASKVLRAAHDSWFGLEGLAIVFSLPRVLMIWAITLFAGAFLTLCFRETTLVTRVLSGVPTALIAYICMWSFWILRASDIMGFTSKIGKAVEAFIHRCQSKFRTGGTTATDDSGDGPACLDKAEKGVYNSMV